MKEFIKENWFKIIIVVVLLVTASSYAFGKYAYYQKQQAQIILGKEKQEQLRLEKETRDRQNEKKKINLENCLIQIEEKTKRLFKGNFKNCQTESGINFECLNQLEVGIDKMKKEGKDECFKKYPQ